MLENIFLRVIEISFSTTAVILLMVLITDITEKKFSSKTRYWIWIIIVLRLIIPINISIPSAPINVKAPSGDLSLEYDIPERTEEISVISDASSITGYQNTETEKGETAVTIIPEKEVKAEIPLVFILSLAWLFGTIVSIIKTIYDYCKYKRRLFLWNQGPNEDMESAFSEVAMEYGVKKIPVYINRIIKSPMMVGFFHPSILIPQTPLTKEEYKYVLYHELMHYVRGDVWYKFAISLALSVHWFNPFIALLKNRSENDIEISCDENASKNFTQKERKEYCTTILKNIKMGKESEFFLSTGFRGGKDVILKRFEAVLSPKMKLGATVIAVSLIFTLLCGMSVSVSLPSSYQGGRLFSVTDKKTVSETLAEAIKENSTERRGNTFPSKEEIEKYNNKFSGIFETVSFGNYEQNNNNSDGKEPIEWLLLDEKGGYMLLLSKYAIDCHRYNDFCGEITWEESTINNWMNSEFIDSAFSDEERLRIKDGNVTLLTMAEVRKYFPSTYSKIAYVTKYASFRCGEKYRNVCSWYVIQENDISHLSSIIDEDGSELIYGNSFDDDITCFRPAVWVKI